MSFAIRSVNMSAFAFQRSGPASNVRFKGDASSEPSREITFEHYWTEVLNNPRLAMSHAELACDALRASPNKPFPTFPPVTLDPSPFMTPLTELTEADKLLLLIGPPGTGRASNSPERLAAITTTHLDRTSRKTHDLRFVPLPGGGELMSWVENPNVRYQLKWVHLPYGTPGVTPGDSDFIHPDLLETPLHLFSARHPEPPSIGQIVWSLYNQTPLPEQATEDGYTTSPAIPGAFKYPQQQTHYQKRIEAACMRKGITIVPKLNNDGLTRQSHAILDSLLARYRGDWDTVLVNHVRAVEVPIKQGKND